MSAHRTPLQAIEFRLNAKSNGFGVIICAAGKAAYLAGIVAAHTTLPVIGIPMNSGCARWYRCTSIYQFRCQRVAPVATVAIDGAENAALLAIQILAVYDEQLSTNAFR